MKYNYGDSWEKYPLEEGQTWYESRGSLVSVFDIFNGIPKFMLEADLIYCDPPWNTGNINSFYTKAEIETRRTFDDFTYVLFDHILHISPDVCYLEIGKQNLGKFKTKMSELYEFVQSWQVTYYKKNISYLVRGSRNGFTEVDFTRVDDTDTPLLAMQCEQFDCVADLCTGRGLTGITAYKLGKKFVGTELNKRRLAVMIDKTSQMGARWSK